MSDSATWWSAAYQASLSFTISWNLLKLMSIESAMPSNHPSMLSPSPPGFSLSQHQGLFQWVGSSHQVAKILGFSFSISPSNEYSGLISFRIDWFDLLAVQRTLKSLLQHHNSEASVLWRSGFFMAQLSHPYITTRKTSIFGFLITEPNRELALSLGCGIYERVFLYGRCPGCSVEWILSGVWKCQVIRMYFMGILPVRIRKHDCEAISKGNCHFNGFNHHAEKVAHRGVQYFLKVCMWEVVERVFLLRPPTQPVGIVILPQPVTSSL